MIDYDSDRDVWVLVDHSDGRYITRRVEKGTPRAVYIPAPIWRAMGAHWDQDAVFQDMLRRIDNSLYNGGDGQ